MVKSNNANFLHEISFKCYYEKFYVFQIKKIKIMILNYHFNYLRENKKYIRLNSIKIINLDEGTQHLNKTERFSLKIKYVILRDLDNKI